MQRLLNQLVPFLVIGMAIVAFIFGIMLLFHLFFFGTMIGLVLYLIAWIREKFFPPKIPATFKKHTGRIIEADEWKKR